MKICPIILAGGSGTRLWPMSREHYPKQLLPLHGDETLLQQTATRLDGLATDDGVSLMEPIVVCNEEHRFLIAEQLRRIGRLPKAIMLEPVARNTAPALTIAAHAACDGGEDPVMMVMPADHVIRELDALQVAVSEAARIAGEGLVATFGIVPDRPETGYGYIRKGDSYSELACELDAFVEKPDSKRAEAYLKSGEYLWNSGMFVIRAGVWLEAIARFQPEMAAACREAFDGKTADSEFLRVEREAFERSPSDSIDYAVMERLVTGESKDAAPRATVIPLDAGWSDVGAWPALWEISPGDADSNVIRGDVCAVGSSDSLILAEHRLVATVGLHGAVVIETPDAVLVTDKSNAQDVKQVVEWLKTHQREERKNHRRVYRPWGSYEGLDNGERYQVKRLTISPGAAISLQLHHHRAEHWIVVRGTAKVTRGEEEFLLSENESTYIPLGEIHRLENPGKVDLEIIEVQSGSYLGEDDIERFEDRYNRS